MRRTRWLVAGVIVLAFGLGCLNYTKADGLEHHREVARTHGLPPPGNPSLYGGDAAVALGAGGIGYSIGAGRRP